MGKQPDINDVLEFVLRDPKNTTDFLLGTICTDSKNTREDVATIKEKQANIDKKIDDRAIELKKELEKKIATIQLEVDDIKNKNAFNRGVIASITAISTTLAAGILAFGKYIWGLLVVAH